MDVYDVFSGKRFAVATETLLSLKHLHEFIESRLNIPPSRQLLLVAESATQLRLDLISEGQRVFIYDKKLISTQKLSESSELHLEPPEKCPHRSQNANISDLGASPLFVERSQWALGQWELCKEKIAILKHLYDEITVIDEAARLSTKHMSIHTKMLLKSVSSQDKIIKEIKRDIQSCGTWNSSWDSAMKLSVLKTRLPELLDRYATERAYNKCLKLENQLEIQESTLETQVAAIISKSRELLLQMSALEPRAQLKDVQGIESDVRLLSNKIIDETDKILKLSPERRTQTASRMIGEHEREIFPAIEAAMADLQHLYLRKLREKNNAQMTLLKTLKEVALVQSKCLDVRTLMNNVTPLLHDADQQKSIVAQVIDLPFLFGVVILEQSRRRTWLAEMESLCGLTNDKFNHLREREYERIDKWSNHYSSLPLFRKIANLDVRIPVYKIQGSETRVEGPAMSINDYLEELKESGLLEIHEDLKTELEAMSVQLAKSLSQSKLSGSQSYLQRIRELENIVLKLRIEANDPASSSGEGLPGNGSRATSDTSQTSKSQLNGPSEDPVDTKSEPLLAEHEHQKVEALEARINALEEEKRQGFARREEYEDLCRQLQDKLSSLEGILADRVGQSDLRRNFDESLVLKERCRDLSQRLYTTSHRLDQILECMGLQAHKTINNGVVEYSINRVRGLSRRGSSSKIESAGETVLDETEADREVPLPDTHLLQWVEKPEFEEEYREFLDQVFIDFDKFRMSVSNRFKEVEKVARKYHSEVRKSRADLRSLEQGYRQRLSLNKFQPDDLILFLPTRDPSRLPNPWAAFNVNAPHYFLDPRDTAQLQGREYVIGRATEVIPHVVEVDNEERNPFGLPIGVKWYYIKLEW